MAGLPPLPAGFALDGDAMSAPPPLPAGFEIDQPQQTSTQKPRMNVGRELVPGINIEPDARAAIDQFGQAATFGFGDEIADRIGAGIASLATDEKYDDLLQEARQNSKSRLSEQFQEHPAISLGAGLTGAFATGGIGASTKAGTALTNSLRTGNLASRVGKGAIAGGASGGLYGAGTSEEGKRLEGAESGAKLGAAVGAGLPVAGAAVGAGAAGAKNAYRGARARGVDQLDDAVSVIRGKADDSYKKMRDMGVELMPKGTQKISHNVDSAIRERGTINKKLHSQTRAALKDFRKDVRSGNMNLQDLENHRRVFSEIGADLNNKSDAGFAKAIKKAIDNSLDGLDEKSFAANGREALSALKDGRSNAARAFRAETVVDAIKRADGDANAIKRNLNSLLTTKAGRKKIQGFSESEMSALKEASRNTTGEGILKMLGRFGFDIGGGRAAGTGVGAAVGAGVGGATAGYGGAAVVPVVGTAARMGQKAIARGKAENLLNAIEGAAKSGSSASKPISALGALPAGGAAGAISQGGAQNIAPQMERQIMKAPLPPQASTEPPPDLMNRIAMAESSGNPNAQAPTSSASGLFQFTDPTWKSVVKKYGRKHGIKLGDKSNPDAQRIMAQELADEHRKALKPILGREPNDGEIYLAHFAGSGGAKRLLKAPSQAPAAKLLPAAAKANRNVFYDGKRMRSAGEVIQLLSEKV